MTDLKFKDCPKLLAVTFYVPGTITIRAGAVSPAAIGEVVVKDQN